MSLEKTLAGFQARGGFGRTEYFQPRLPKLIGNAERQRPFGADHREINLLLEGERLESHEIIRLDRNTGREAFDAGIPWRAKNLRLPRTLGDFPDQGMLATATADYENLHSSTFT